MSYLFLFSPNNSGTTVISQYIATQCDAYLPPFGNCEGQMAPSVKPMMRNKPWKPDTEFDWTFIKGEWDRLLEESGRQVFVEASPPNLMRVEEILEVFAHDMQAVFSISSPYLHIASCIYNYSAPPLKPRQAGNVATNWLRKASALRDAVMKFPQFGRITYEEFCADPSKLNACLALPVKKTGDVLGKGNTREKRIRDMTNATVPFLSSQELDAASEKLAEHPDILSFFGYEVESGETLINRAAGSGADFQSGLFRRVRWELSGKEDK